MTDKELMQEVYSGNQEALSDLIELYYADIFRFCLFLRTYEELKFKDIAKMMGCSVSTVKSRFRLGVQHLKRMVEDGNGKS